MDQFRPANIYFKNYINTKDPHIKDKLHQKFKNYRNIIATLMKTKLNYFTKYSGFSLKVNKITSQNILNLISKTFKTRGRELKPLYHLKVLPQKEFRNYPKP